jgi:hypothetical protein
MVVTNGEIRIMIDKCHTWRQLKAKEDVHLHMVRYAMGWGRFNIGIRLTIQVWSRGFWPDAANSWHIITFSDTSNIATPII